ncbi:MAG: amidohydrolase family protein [Gemmatimonadales bacterium]
MSPVLTARCLVGASPLLFAPAVTFAMAVPPAGPDSQLVAFVNVHVISMDREGVLQRQTVVIRDGRIVALGPADRVRVPAGAVRIDGRGKYLMPGLAEMHAHLPNPNAPGASPELTETVLFLYVANGVTSARGMQGHSSQLELRDRIAKGELVGPRLWVGSPALSGNTVPTADSARRLVEQRKAAGYDHLKIHEGLSREIYDTIVATARRVKISFAGHVPDAVGLDHALAAGQSTVDHLDNYLLALEADDSPIKNAPPQERAQQLIYHMDEGKLPSVAAATKAAGAWMVPTMALWETFAATESLDSLRAREELRYVPTQWRDAWAQAVATIRQNNPDAEGGRRVVELRRHILKALDDAGVKILLGTDSPQLFSVPGFSIHRELKSMLAAGMTPYEILQAGTRNVAVYAGAADDFGTVAVGRRADLLLLDGNPLEHLGNVARRAGVMVNGRWLPEAEIQARLARIAAGFAN